MNFKTLTKSGIRSMADSSAVYERGVAYAKDGSVDPVSAGPTTITASVAGNYGDYTVVVREVGNDLKTTCDCPYDGLVCKHIVAVLLCYLEGEFDEVETEEDPSSALRQTLTAMAQADLVKLVAELAEDRPEFLQLLLERVTIAPTTLKEQPRNPARVKKFQQRIAKLIDEGRFSDDDDGYDRYHGYYHDDVVEFTSLEPILTEVQTLHPADQIEVYWDTIENLDEAVEEYGLSTTQIEMALGLYGKAVKALNLPHKEKKKYFGDLCDALTWSMCGYGDTTNAIKQALDTICSEPEDYRHLIKVFKELNDQEQDEWIAGYYLKLGDEKNYLKIRRANLNHEAQFLDLAQYWEQKNNQKEYLATLESYLSQLGKRRTHDNYAWMAAQPKATEGVFARLIGHYEAQNDLPNLYRVLLTEVETGVITLDRYHRLRTISRAVGKWETCQPILLKLAKRNPESLAQIYLFERQWDDAIKLAKEKDTYEQVKLTVAEGIKQEKPDVAIEIYAKLMEAHIDHRSRNSYKTAAAHAAAMKGIYLTILRDESAWLRLLEQVRTVYKRLPALQDEFRHL